ncbi:MAG: hypothetical protein K8R36_01305 [Planctomycetales bacterium]|nr:hypothetical protein [Planctomycetales bacterium]
MVAFVFVGLAMLAWGVVRDPTKSAVSAGKQHFEVSPIDAEIAVPLGMQHLQSPQPSQPDSLKNDPAARNFVSLSYQNRGYCYAASQLKDSKAPGGYAKSENVARRVETDSGRGLYLLAEPEIVTTYDKGPGMRVVLVNQTSDLLAFKASDSRLAIIQEAQDSHGKWKPIEYLPSSWCGNSSHRVFLRPGFFWAFAAPRYQGDLKTKLRFTMNLGDGSQLHSNVFGGSVNPKQFRNAD